MRIINTELFRPANVAAILVIVVVANWVAHTAFFRHVIDERKRPRFRPSNKRGQDQGPSGGADSDGPM